MSSIFDTYRGTIHWMCQMSCCRWMKKHSPLYEYVLRDLSWNYPLNESVEFLQMNKNHSPLYEYVLRDLSRNYSLNESDEFLQWTFKACNTDPNVSLTLLHAIVRWKELVDRVWVPCVMCRLPPGVEHGTKLGDVLCWDFALLVVFGFILLSWESQFTVESEGGGMFVGLVLCIERKSLQSGKPTREYWMTTFFSKCQFMRSLKTQDHNW